MNSVTSTASTQLPFQVAGATASSSGKAPQQVSQPSTPSDAEVIAKVVNTEIKPSNVSLRQRNSWKASSSLWGVI